MRTFSTMRVVCIALALAAGAVATTGASTTASTTDLTHWTSDYKSWIEDIQLSVEGNAVLAQKATALETALDAAVAAGVSESDRMRLLYDFLIAVDSDPTFQGFVVKDTPTKLAAAATPTAAPLSSSAARSTLAATQRATLAMLVLAAISYVTL